MTAVMAILNTLRRIPRGGWIMLAASVGIALAFYAVRATVHTIQATERARVLAEGAAVDHIALRWQRAAYQRQIDSARVVANRLRDSVRVGVRTVYRWTPLIPDSLRRKVASVDSLVRACTRLAKDCDSLRVVSARVDTLMDTVRVIDNARIQSLELKIVQRDGRIRELEAKSCRLPAGVGTALGGALGFYIGRSR